MAWGEQRSDDVWNQDTEVFERFSDEDLARMDRAHGRIPKRSQTRRYVIIAVAAAVIGAALTVGGVVAVRSLTSSPQASPAAAPPAATKPAAPVTTTAAGTPFVYTVEPWSTDGKPAKAHSALEDCSQKNSTSDIASCYQDHIENTDAAIDALQLARFTKEPESGRADILAEDSAWLAARPNTCNVFKTGGTIDRITFAKCLLDISEARLADLQGITVPKATLGLPTFKENHDVKDSDWALADWYTTPKGSRIAATVTSEAQAASTTCWQIIGGPSGFTVDPTQFYFAKGSEITPGQTPANKTSPAGHHVAPGENYGFCLSYKGAKARLNQPGSFTYSPDTPVAEWKRLK
ncbi:lysozyme inhibitor LprI family protein [Nocardia sp. NPDC051030]|uniref:lysozyme inhibitor LprI family protein n=1 Tax=Nocardia sp. NPDC051030 TaxID=3155162 RepID=UPI0034435870